MHWTGHPAGIQPEGNLIMKGGINCRDQGLGQLHVLSDALVLDILGYLCPQDLARMACTSKALYCFCDQEDLWKACVLEAFEGNFTWRSSWRDTFIASSRPEALGTAEPGAALPVSTTEAAVKKKHKKRKRPAMEDVCAPSPAVGQLRRALRVSNFYSDLLYQPWHCATVEVDPAWLEVDNVDRRADLGWEEFHTQYELPNRPVVLTGAAADWPALDNWDITYLKAAYGSRPVIAGNCKMPFPTYAAYAETTCDEMPLYLFDKEFATAAGSLAQDFKVPDVFKEDLFSVLGDARPDYRWLIAGPSRSGSSFHIDPNATNAWNAVVCGAKKWILYPPSCPPPGVHPSADGADVATPVSLLEWFINFYADTKLGKVRPIECVVRPGDVMFVPRGWWHACLNLHTWTIAVTQNFVSRANLRHVLDFLKPGRADLVSGCSLSERGQLYTKFSEAMEKQHPELMAVVAAERQEADRKAAEARKLSSLFSKAVADTDQTATHMQQERTEASTQPSGGGFTFGFSL